MARGGAWGVVNQETERVPQLPAKKLIGTGSHTLCTGPGNLRLEA